MQEKHIELCSYLDLVPNHTPFLAKIAVTNMHHAPGTTTLLLPLLVEWRTAWISFPSRSDGDFLSSNLIRIPVYTWFSVLHHSFSCKSKPAHTTIFSGFSALDSFDESETTALGGIQPAT